jgi:hypothetical protein
MVHDAIETVVLAPELSFGAIAIATPASDSHVGIQFSIIDN